MAPKKDPTPFEVDGVECTFKDGLINAGLNAGLPRPLRFPAKVNKSATPEEMIAKVRAHDKFAAAATWVAGSSAGPSTSAAAPPRGAAVMPPPAPLMRERAGLGLAASSAATSGASASAAAALPAAAFFSLPAEAQMRPLGAGERCPYDFHRCERCGTDACQGAIVMVCSTCGVELCIETCSRRGACPDHAGSILDLFTAYAEVAAGIGCRCSCCLRQLDLHWWWHPLEFLSEDYREDEPPKVGGCREDCQDILAALAVVGNPPCALGDAIHRVMSEHTDRMKI